ncbi:MAG: serine protease [Rhodanobacter sp.]
MAGLVLAAVGSVRAASLDPALLPKIQAATFEVVQAKPVDDPLTYERPLPLDVLPYQQRTDKYHSIGTAFALGNNRFVTAGHVLLAGVGSLWGAPELRDADGKVYPIGKIEKFSLRKDFVVFSLATPMPTAVALAIDSKPALNQVVYTVGNALGTGVVIRDGLYTSNTPEEQDGSWRWMRFSAAASPGNSGGPLLDKDGKLIGVVLMKSPNENLNYALPISEVLGAPDDVAELDQRMPYQFDVFDSTLSNVFKAQFALPKSFADFSATYQKLLDAWLDSQLQALLAKEPDKLFPRGAGSSKLLHSPAVLREFPAMIVRNSAGEWGLSGRSGGKITLPDNGYVEPGIAAGRNLLFHVRKPDSVSAAELYGKPDALMDALLKVGFLKRPVGSEQVLITSLGKPLQDTVHTDAWQRRWQVRVWALPFINGKVVTFSLPVPDGYVTLMRIMPASQAHDYLINMRAMTDFIFVTYSGTLAQWQDYLRQTPLLPAAFADIHLDIAYDQHFRYSSRRVAFGFTPQLQKITADSVLQLGFDFFLDHDRPVWDVADVRVWKTRSANDSWINIERVVAPAKDLGDDLQAHWLQVAQRQHPFDAVARLDNDVMKITAVVAAPAPEASPAFLYTVFYGVKGSQSLSTMKTRLELLTKDLRVLER